jgi:hypothetical protein
VRKEGKIINVFGQKKLYEKNFGRVVGSEIK